MAEVSFAAPAKFDVSVPADSSASTGYIYTVGHGGRTIDELVDHLQRLKVQYLIDVRSAPYSKYQPEFSRGSLEGLLRQHGLKYVFMGDDLGGRPEDPDCYDKNGNVHYSICRTKEFFLRGISRLRNAYNQNLRICLLCSEGKPWQCHRSKLVGAALLDENIEALHILPDGEIRTQSEVIRELTRGQDNLFGEHFVSRKIYR